MLSAANDTTLMINWTEQHFRRLTSHLSSLCDTSGDSSQEPDGVFTEEEEEEEVKTDSD